MSSVPNYGRYKYEDDYKPKHRPRHDIPDIKVVRGGQKKRPKAKSYGFRQGALFAICAGIVSFGVCSVIGRAMEAKAARDIGVYHSRAKAAKVQSEQIKQKLDININPKKVRDWADNHGFTKEEAGVSENE